MCDLDCAMTELHYSSEGWKAVGVRITEFMGTCEYSNLIGAALFQVADTKPTIGVQLNYP